MVRFGLQSRQAPVRTSPSRLCYDSSLMLQTILPDSVTQLSDTELDDRIRVAREKLGRRLVILGHHYQRDEVIKFADVRGDSFKLAQWAANRKDAEYIMFCGVHF